MDRNNIGNHSSLFESNNDGRNLQIKDIDKTLPQLIDADYGSHFLIAYPDLSTFRKIYAKCVKKYLVEDNDTVLMLPFYETTNDVRRYLKKEMTDILQYEKDSSLLIIDSMKAYFSEIGLMTFVDSMLKHTKATGKSGLSVIADMNSFYHMHKIHQLVEHEISLPVRYDAKLRGYCLYHQGNFDNLTKQQKQAILEHHGKNIVIE